MSRRTELLLLAKRLGWQVEPTGGGHLRMTKLGCRTVIASSSPGDRRARLNMLAELRRAERAASASAHGAEARDPRRPP